MIRSLIALIVLGTLACGLAPDGLTGDHRVDLPAGKTMRLPASDWTPMENEHPWAENFQATLKVPRRAYQVVTVFKLPMNDDDRRRGERISPNEYIEAFVSNPGELTVLIRVDKGSYWVLSREMFAAPAVSASAAPTELRSPFKAEIDTTRYLLQSVF